MKRTLLLLIAALAMLVCRAQTKPVLALDTSPYATDRGFRHPGGLHTAADFARIRQQLADGNPKVTEAYNVLKASSYASPTYQTYPVETIVRGGGTGENYMNAARAAHAAYQNALRWQIEGNRQCAQHAVDILMAWARVTRHISGDSNYALAAGLYGYEFAQAAEIVRDFEGWAAEDFTAFQRWMFEVWYPSAIGFLRQRNGTWENADKWWQAPGHYWSNWGLCNALCVMSIGVLCDDPIIYNQGLSFIKYDQCSTFQDPRTTDPIRNDGLTEFWGNLIVTHVPWDKETGAYGEVGQMNESGRDTGHAAMALGVALDVAHQAYNQGDDLFAYMDHRLAAGIEYLAAQTQSVADLPWTPYAYGTNGIYYTDSRCWVMGEPALGAQMRPYWGTVIGIYEGEKGVSMPFAHTAYDQMGVDGGCSGSTSGGFDHLGFSVLMNTRDSIADRQKAPVEMQARMIVNGQEIAHNELGALINTFQMTALQDRGVAPGTVITLSPTLPDTVADTGQWRWETGETTRELTITATESRLYRVHYTNAYGRESEQCYSIAVLGDCMATTLRPTIDSDGQHTDGLTATVTYGSDATLALNPLGGWGDYEWADGEKSSTLTLHALTHDRQVSGCYINHGGRRCTVTFTLHVSPFIPSAEVNAQPTAVEEEICVNEGDDVALKAVVADALAGGTYRWDTGETTSEIDLPNRTQSETHIVEYRLGTTTYTYTFTLLVRPATPQFLPEGYYKVRHRASDRYLTAEGRSATATFDSLNAADATHQTWYVYHKSATQPLYSMRLMADSTFLSIQGKMVASGVARPHRLVLAAGTQLATWLITTSGTDSYVAPAADGQIDMKAGTDFTGYTFELIPIAVTAISAPAATAYTGERYNLAGQRVATPRRGQVVITDGKKIMH